MKYDNMLINISLVCSSILFVSGLWAIDIGTNETILISAECITNILGLSSESKGIEQYHSGIIMCLGGFVLAISTLIWRNKK